MSIQIRMAVESDVTGMLEIYGPIIRETATSFEYEVPDLAAFWQRVKKVQEQSPWLVCIIDGVVAGYAYASPHRGRTAYQWNRELSVYVRSEFRGKSIATALYQALIEIIRKQGFTNALIGITLPNQPSVQFHEKLGFLPVGIYRDIGFKFGKYHDVGWWQMKISHGQPKAITLLNALDKEITQGIFGKHVHLIEP